MQHLNGIFFNFNFNFKKLKLKRQELNLTSIKHQLKEFGRNIEKTT